MIIDRGKGVQHGERLEDMDVSFVGDNRKMKSGKRVRREVCIPCAYPFSGNEVDVLFFGCVES